MGNPFPLLVKYMTTRPGVNDIAKDVNISFVHFYLVCYCCWVIASFLLTP